MDRIHLHENVLIVTADCTIMYAMKKISKFNEPFQKHINVAKIFKGVLKS